MNEFMKNMSNNLYLLPRGWVDLNEGGYWLSIRLYTPIEWKIVWCIEWTNVFTLRQFSHVEKLRDDNCYQITLLTLRISTKFCCFYEENSLRCVVTNFQNISELIILPHTIRNCRKLEKLRQLRDVRLVSCFALFIFFMPYFPEIFFSLKASSPLHNTWNRTKLRIDWTSTTRSLSCWHKEIFDFNFILYIDMRRIISLIKSAQKE